MSTPKSLKDQIRQLKADGFSQREIARLTGTARNTVAKILKGEADEARRREQEAREELDKATPETRIRLVENYWKLNHARNPRGREEEVIDRASPPGLQLREPELDRYRVIHAHKVHRGEVPWR